MLNALKQKIKEDKELPEEVLDFKDFILEEEESADELSFFNKLEEGVDTTELSEEFSEEDTNSEDMANEAIELDEDTIELDDNIAEPLDEDTNSEEAADLDEVVDLDEDADLDDSEFESDPDDDNTSDNDPALEESNDFDFDGDNDFELEESFEFIPEEESFDDTSIFNEEDDKKEDDSNNGGFEDADLEDDGSFDVDDHEEDEE